MCERDRQYVTQKIATYFKFIINNFKKSNPFNQETEDIHKTPTQYHLIAIDCNLSHLSDSNLVGRWAY